MAPRVRRQENCACMRYCGGGTMVSQDTYRRHAPERARDQANPNWHLVPPNMDDADQPDPIGDLNEINLPYHRQEEEEEEEDMYINNDMDGGGAGAGGENEAPQGMQVCSLYIHALRSRSDHTKGSSVSSDPWSPSVYQ
jgi:hypothetical protein